MKKAIFGLATGEQQAHHLVNELLSAGFPKNNISILSPDREGKTNEIGEPSYTSKHPADITSEVPTVVPTTGKLTTEKHTKAPEGGVAGATTGGILGGSLGLLAGIGALAIPGIGPFIAAGPIMAALSGSAVGGGLGLLIGALIGSGIPEYEAKKYEESLKAGHILVSVQVENDNELKNAVDIMKKEGALDITATGISGL